MTWSSSRYFSLPVCSSRPHHLFIPPLSSSMRLLLPHSTATAALKVLVNPPLPSDGSFASRLSADCISNEKSPVASVNADCCGFLPWLQQKAGREISSKLKIGDSEHGRSLFASDLIEEGDCMLKVPYSVHLTPDRLLPEVESLFSADVSTTGRLAAVLLSEKKLGQDSTWAMYVNNLPLLKEMHNTIFWGKDELEMIRPSSVYRETLNQKTFVKREFHSIKLALECFPQTFGNISFKDFMHAYATVGSRAWGTSKGLSLIPFADFLNHDGSSESVLLSDDDKETSEVIADRDYVVGDEVMIRYGKFPNAILLLDFGFTLAYNMHDQVQIYMDIPQHDSLCKHKLELLHKHSMTTTTRSISNFYSYGFSFTIKEVRSLQGKGKGIPQSLRAFARVLCAKSTEELEAMKLEAVNSDGRLARRPLKDKYTEFCAHQIIHSHITDLVQLYDSSIESLNPAGFVTDDCKLHLRRKMARDLLTGELRVLKSASSWLTNYCKSLSTC